MLNLNELLADTRNLRNSKDLGNIDEEKLRYLEKWFLPVMEEMIAYRYMVNELLPPGTPDWQKDFLAGLALEASKVQG